MRPLPSLWLILLSCLFQQNMDAQVSAQPAARHQGAWSLQDCIQYALSHNLQLEEAALNTRLSELVLKQYQYARFPSLNGDASIGESYGKSIDPTSNQFVNKGFSYNSMTLSSQMLLFGWFQKRYQIEQNSLELAASVEAGRQTCDDISLNIATGFLNILLAREQVHIHNSQVKTDEEQYEQTQKFAAAGQVPELNVAQMYAQLSNDSASLVNAISNEKIAVLQLKALMCIPFEEVFEIAAPGEAMMEPVLAESLPEAETVFNTALKNQHRHKYNTHKLESARKALSLARSAQYPQLNLFGSLGTNFSSTTQDITNSTYAGDVVLGYVNVSGTDYPITRPTYTYSTHTRPLFTQYGDNLRTSIGLDLSIPLFNARSAHLGVQKARIGVQAQELILQTDELKLRQDIYRSYEELKAASQKYIAARKAEDAARHALEMAGKRYQAGMISTFEYTTSQNSYYTASANVISAKYDFIFKRKVLDYYMGNPLKL